MEGLEVTHSERRTEWKYLFTSPMKSAARTTVKKGSIALMVWVNDTATFPRLMFVKRLPIVCAIARGKIAAS